MARLAFFVTAGLLLAIPNVLHIRRETGVWSISNRTNWAALIHSEELDGPLDYEARVLSLTPGKHATMAQGGFGQVSMVKSYATNLGFMVRDVLKKVAKTYRLVPSVLSLTAIALAALGLFGLRWSRTERWAEVYLAGALIPWLVVYPLYDIDFENLSPIVPIVLLRTGVGLVKMADRVRRGMSGSWPSWLRRSGAMLAALVLAAAVF